MSDILTLHWSEHHARAVVARADRGGVRVTGGFDEVWPDSANPAQSRAAAGSWLGERVRAAGYTGRDVRIVLPRLSTIVRRLDLPAVPVEELPPMVEMQAATRSASGLDGLALDFVPVELTSSGSAVLAATASRALLDTITAVCEGAGLRVVSVGIGPVASAELVVRATNGSPDESALLVNVHDQTLETTLVRGGRVLFTQSSEIHGETDDQIGKAVSADIRRSLVAHGDGLAAKALDHVWWMGDADRTATQRAIVSERLGIPVEPFDPLSNDVVSAEGVTIDGSVVAGAIGMALAGGAPRIELFDFLNPRKPPKKVDVKRQRMIYAGSIAAVLLVGLLIYRQVSLSRLVGRIETMQSEISEATRFTNDHEKESKQAAEGRKWLGLRRDWLGDVAALEAELPDRDRALMSELHLEANQRLERGKIWGKGRAKSREEVEEFYNQLDRLGYTVPAQEIPGGGTGAEYDVRFDLDVILPDPSQKDDSSAEVES